MRYLKFLALLLIFFLTMAIFAQNMGQLGNDLSLSFALGGKTWFVMAAPIYLYLLSALVLGGLMGAVFFFTERMRLSGQVRKCRGRLAALEQEVNSLRNLPLEDKAYPAMPATPPIATPEAPADTLPVPDSGDAQDDAKDRS